MTPVTDQALLSQLNAGGSPVDAVTQKFLDGLEAKSTPSFSALPGPLGNLSMIGAVKALPGIATKIFDTIGSGYSAPGDVYTGALPITSPTGGYNPAAITRAADFASVFSPSTAAMRAGEGIPGFALANSAPSAQQLKAAGSAGYDAARASGLEIHPAVVSDLGTRLQNDLTRQGFGSAVAPGTHSILDSIANPSALAAGETRHSTISDIMALRENLGKVDATATDGAAAGRAKRAVDEFLGTLDPSHVVAGTIAPEEVAGILRNANANYAAAQRSNALTGDLQRANTGFLDKAEARAAASNSGHNIDNSIRQKVASFLQNPDNVAGFSQAEIDALNAFVQGTATRNAARSVGNILGGGGGLGHLAASSIGGALGLASGHGLEGMGVGATALPVMGHLAKGLENWLARRSLSGIDELVRQRSPLYQALQAQGALMTPAMGRNSAVLRSVLPGMMGAPVPAQHVPFSLGGPWI